MGNSNEEAQTSKTYTALCKERQYIRARVSRIYNRVSVQFDFEALSEVRKTEYFEKLKDLQNKLVDVNERIHAVLPESVDEDSLMTEEEVYDEQVAEALAVLKPSATLNESVNNSVHSNVEVGPSKLKLPHIALPEFSHNKRDNFEKFIYGFESIISKLNLSDYERFMYLKNQLRGGPLALVNSLEVEQQTYESAKDLLTEAFASPPTQKYDAIKKLTDLDLKLNGDVYSYISDMRNVISSFNSLKIDVDVVLQYFIWHSLNDRFQTQLINITNNSKPTLEEINKHIFAATDRYLKVNERINERRKQFNKHPNYEPMKFQSGTAKTCNMAINVENKNVKFCNLCLADGKNNVTHIMKNCKAYPNALDKIRKLEAINQCSRCSFANHVKENCRFRFASLCRLCKGQHMTFLCSSEPATSLKTVSNTSVVYFNNAVRNDDHTILPSFSVGLVTRLGNLTGRALYDSGSQKNFLSRELASKLPLKVVRNNVAMEVRGMYDSKVINSKVVEVSILVNNKPFSIEAFVVPDISIAIKIPELNLIVKSLEDMDYILADTQLKTSENLLAGFDFVMGSDSLPMLEPHTRLIGQGMIKSSLLLTTAGVMLTGDPDMLLTNLRKESDILHNRETVNPSVSSERTDVIDDNTTGNYFIDSYSCLYNITECVSESDEIIPELLEKPLQDILEQCSDNILNVDNGYSEGNFSEVNQDIINYVLSNTQRAEDGRLIMPLPWNPDCCHLLGKNFNLSKKILYSNLKKLKTGDKLQMYDKVFKEQEEMGIIERIEDVYGYMKSHPNCSFLPHMGIFKLNRETTKVRIVYLSNLCEKTESYPNAVSHNNALFRRLLYTSLVL